MLLLTLILLPKALAELENERLNAAKAYLAPTYRLGGLGILIIILLSGVFWIFFPRFGAVHSSMISSVGGGATSRRDRQQRKRRRAWFRGHDFFG